MKIKKPIIYVAAAVIILAGSVLGYVTFFMSGQYDEFLECVDNSGAALYGAFWCPHCIEQKELFGKSAKYLPYVECSTSDGKGQTQICEDEGIESYPTWKFADGTEQTGLITLPQLAYKTGCILPED